MRIIKLKSGAFTTLNFTDFVARAREILQQLTLHADVFVAPPVPTATLKAAIDDLAQKTILAGGDEGSHTARNARDAQKQVVLNMLLQNGSYVLGIATAQSTTEAQISMVELAGYTIANESRNPVALEPVQGLKVSTTGMPGDSTVNVRWIRGKARAFIVQTTQGDTSNPATVWTDAAFSTRSKIKLKLAPGVWSIRVITVGSNSRLSSPSLAAQIVVG